MKSRTFTPSSIPIVVSSFRKDGVVVGPQGGDPFAVGGGRLRQDHRHGGEAEVPLLLEEAADPGVLGVHDLPHVQHGAAGDLGVAAALLGVELLPAEEPLRQGGTEVGGVVGHPVVIGGAEGIVLQVVEAQGVAEALPVVLGVAAHGQVAVRRLEGVVGGAGGVIVALAGLDLADGAVGHRGGLDAGVHGVLQGDVHQLADAPLLPVDEGQRHGGGQVSGGVVLRDAGAGLDGVAAGHAGHIHGHGPGLDRQGGGGSLRQGAGKAVGGDGGQDQVRLLRLQACVVQAQGLGLGGAEVGADHVGLPEEGPRQGGALRLGVVQQDALLPGGEVAEVEALAVPDGGVAAGGVPPRGARS